MTTQKDTRTLSCAERWQSNKDSRVSDLRRLLAAWHAGDEERQASEIGTLSDYGLSFDYVPAGTFADQTEGYWRYQISWGGPSDEFRFYASGCGEYQLHRIGYAFLDWFDGHERALAGDDFGVMLQIWAMFADTGWTATAYREAMRRGR